MRRVGKHIVVDLAGDLALLVHLMSAGRLQLFDKRASLRDRTSRLLVRLADGNELRLREFGTRSAAWVKVLRAEDVADDDALATLGPEAWPDPPPLRELLAAQGARPLHGVLRDQHVIAGIGRSWVDEILWTAMLSPFKRADDLDDDEADGAARRRASSASTARIEHYERVVTLPIPDKLPMPLEIHRHAGRAVPALRRDDRGGPLRGLRHVLLPARPDRRARAQGPPALAPAEVAAGRRGAP